MVLQTPPGATWDMKEEEIVSILTARLQPYMDGEKEPALKNYYIWLFAGGGTIGARVQDQSRVKELEHMQARLEAQGEELRQLVREARGRLGTGERRMLESVFDFEETTAREVMIPLPEVVSVPESAPVSRPDAG